MTLLSLHEFYFLGVKMKHLKPFQDFMKEFIKKKVTWFLKLEVITVEYLKIVHSKVLWKKSFKHKLSICTTPQQNRVVERINHPPYEMGRSMLNKYSLPK
jgi:hypothetical protein